MAHTQKSVIKALGKEAQVSGGAIIVYRGGKHIAVSKFVNGLFTVTPEGLEILESPQVTTDEGVDVVVNGAGRNSKKKGAKVEVVDVEEVTEVAPAAEDFDLDIEGLDLGGN